MDQETDSPRYQSPKRTWLIALISLVSIASIAALGTIWKKNADTKKAVISNRVIASKMSKLGEPFPENFDQKVNLGLLKQDALDGNQISQEILELYQHRKSANETLVLGNPTPEKMPDAFDLKMFKRDADAGNPNAALQLELID
ncbi:MAG: hypothetical protein ACJAR1_002716 [Rubritalea sp.]|jgi:hypothetical protein